MLTGFPIPRLSPRGVAGRREVLAVPGRNGEPSFEVDELGRPSTSVFAVFYLPRDLDWRRAAVSSVLRREVTSLYVQLPPDDRPWPQAVAHRRHRFVADGGLRAVSGDDFTVVERGRVQRGGAGRPQRGGLRGLVDRAVFLAAWRGSGT